MLKRNRAPIIVLAVLIAVVVFFGILSYVWTPESVTHKETIELDASMLNQPSPSAETPHVEYP